MRHGAWRMARGEAHGVRRRSTLRQAQDKQAHPKQAHDRQGERERRCGRSENLTIWFYHLQSLDTKDNGK